VASVVVAVVVVVVVVVVLGPHLFFGGTPFFFKNKKAPPFHLCDLVTSHVCVKTEMEAKAEESAGERVERKQARERDVERGREREREREREGASSSRLPLRGQCSAFSARVRAPHLHSRPWGRSPKWAAGLTFAPAAGFSHDMALEFALACWSH